MNKEQLKNRLRQYKYCFIYNRDYTPFPLDATAEDPAIMLTSFPLESWWPDMNWGNWAEKDQAVQLPENIIRLPEGGAKLITRRQNCMGYVWKTAPDGSHYKDYTDGFKFSGACLKSKETYGFGRFIWECRMPSYIGAWIGLWLYNGHTQSVEKPEPSFYVEIDFEMFAKSWYKATQVSSGVYKGETHATADHNNSSLRCICPSKRFYWYEIDWQPGYLALYINGRLVFYTTENIPQHEQFVIMSHGIGYFKKMKPYTSFNIGDILGEMIIKQLIHIPMAASKKYLIAKAKDIYSKHIERGGGNSHLDSILEE